MKGYKVYNLHTKQFLVSRNVVFHEDKFPFKDSVMTAAAPASDFPILVIPKSLDIDTLSSIPIVAPTPHPQPPPALVQPLCRFSWTFRPPAYLQDFACAIAHPIAKHLSNNRLNAPYSAFINNVTIVFEPKFFHQAIKHTKWRQAMQEDLDAMLSTNSWSVVPFPVGKTPIGCN